ncbi:MAG: hypothetical protein IPJ77_11740 [Planctomycetes bacterium]|nr:hypothetical protein [Planctomycetota bacterium]
MHARRLGLLGLWFLTLALLAWAVEPDRSAPPAPAWDATTFSSRLTGRGEVRLEAREGGYSSAFAPRSHGYRPRGPRAEDGPGLRPADRPSRGDDPTSTH